MISPHGHHNLKSSWTRGESSRRGVDDIQTGRNHGVLISGLGRDSSLASDLFPSMSKTCGSSRSRLQAGGEAIPRFEATLCGIRQREKPSFSRPRLPLSSAQLVGCLRTRGSKCFVSRTQPRESGECFERVRRAAEKCYVSRPWTSDLAKIELPPRKQKRRFRDALVSGHSRVSRSATSPSVSDSAGCALLLRWDEVMWQCLLWAGRAFVLWASHSVVRHDMGCDLVGDCNYILYLCVDVGACSLEYI